MKQQAIAAEQFGNTAQAYLTSAVHAGGADLDAIRQQVGRFVAPQVLDLGCGAGHVSFAVAPVAASVVAYDLSSQMLDVVAQAAADKQLTNIETRQGPAERLPFADASFDVVVTRFSAHHWLDLPAALAEMRRVLKPDGIAMLVDIVAPPTALCDTVLQTVEFLRDASHVRNYRLAEWEAMLAAAGLACQRGTPPRAWRLVMQFDPWVARMRTPPERVQAIHSVFDRAPEEVLHFFAVQPDHTFSIDAAMFVAGRQEK